MVLILKDYMSATNPSIHSLFNIYPKSDGHAFSLVITAFDPINSWQINDRLSTTVNANLLISEYTIHNSLEAGRVLIYWQQV